ncbi:DEAD/DEAH box helicase [Flammeovirgaceae bacterium SG7u.111]|nr:DEAD/DEAH box helicase [Flammeovirgaceae bacterium SG7u.132]WPO34489.1 DEAD/DEAH box helicase [Flammeovirgaceae bacterium SG7u.111]
MKFEELNLKEEVLEGIFAMGFDEPTPVQEQVIPVILEGKDVIACAQTGTGKTAAFLLPIMDMTLESTGKIKALVISPTRELAQQIDQQLEGLAYFTNTSSIAIYGGGDGAGWEREKRALKEGVDIVVATPGKLLSYLKQGIGDFSGLEFLILDEADRMLDMGFLDDIMTIINMLPKKRQNLLFSATMPPKIRDFAAKMLVEPVEVTLAISKTAAGVVQAAFMVYEEQKIDLVSYLLRDDDVPSVIIFSSTKRKVSEITKALAAKNLSVREMHSGLDQKEREDVIRQFKNKSFNIMVGTDIVARGIDIDSISMVINFDVPNDAEDYVHRVGRTARAASTGEAVTFITKQEAYKFSQIEELIGQEVRKVKLPKSIGEGPVYDPSQKESRGGGRGYGKKPGNKSGKKKGSFTKKPRLKKRND